MPTVDANGIHVAYEESGSASGPALVMLNGAALQLVDWTPRFITALEGSGLRLVRVDNRDCGLSSHLGHAGKARLTTGPNPVLRPAYTLWDMAEDVLELIRALGLESAHLLGFSLGAAIAQAAVITAPGSINTLTLVSSSTGAPDVGAPSAHGRRMLVRSLPPDRAAALDDAIERRRFLASPGDEDGISRPDRVAASMERNWDPPATGRQMAAVRAAGDRTEKLREVETPALVIHGELDPVVDPSGGRALRDALPRARLITYDDMAHDIPSFLAGEIAGAVAAHVASDG